MTGLRREHRTARLPDLSSTRALVTGASGGIGLEIARALARAGAEVVMPVRDRERGARAAADIRVGAPSARIECMRLDLARLDSVRALAAGLRDDGRPIDLLVLNAGIVLLGDRFRHVSVDGYELHFQTNFLGHAVLVLGILPLLLAGRARVAVQTSLAVANARLDLHDPLELDRYTPLRAYGASKLALGLFGVELGRRADALRVGLCHPGIVPDTGIAPGLRGGSPGPGARISRRLGGTPAEAARPALSALMTTPDPGMLVAPSGPFRLSGPPTQVRRFRRLDDTAAAAAVWNLADRVAAGETPRRLGRRT
ncbi:NAD(P)-dependent dehydrogenase (short-subunit alcohol dehydrogenase family) [Agromyces terreus]|uniref:NAD(P)-dependent dehydrogenase (Short-subunit alcohol dehydrogenase family) n=1 Tax=Agromyces terreus TaxID=424795 RepID=A0A9X2HAE8_9MICO|nr:SDR family NAD(P)-dependent oxidoreductase [Agromyces terreus]MCP2372359.1 NAD(P)-dependent dehydrogenase (short-subunit alcohol dehydrogenase family) [Agromyces terreus]